MGRGRSLGRWLTPLVFGGALAGCALLEPPPEPTTIEQRLAMFPTDGLALQKPVTIRWDSHQIPFIEAATDGDAAYTLGLVHAHLRLAQMSVLRLVARGRISEMVGPMAADIDHGLRILDFPRAAEASLAMMPGESRRWLERFVDGINHVQAVADPLPVEHAIMGLRREPWSPTDVLALGRLAGSDVNWLVWMNLLKLRGRADWPALWARLVQRGGDRPVSAAAGSEQEDTELAAGAALDALMGLSRSGSNSLAIAPSRTAGGAAILADDPHLGIGLPNVWLLAGLKSPSYDVVGLMPPGLPIFAIGRNPDVAWGGTNLRAASSDLVDVSGLAPGEIRSRTEHLRVRWWRDRDVTIRETRFGPIVTDAPQLRDLGLPDLALRWMGHRPSDEVSAMLGVARARNFEEYRTALAGFALPGQNMLYADAAGRIAKVMAVRLPARSSPPEDVFLSVEEAETSGWDTPVAGPELPVTVDPPEGFLASANDRPPPSADPAVPVGWFFSPPDRAERMAELVREGSPLEPTRVEGFQRDVHAASSVALAGILVRRMRETGVAETATGNGLRVLQLMEGWDGEYRADQAAPVAFELFRFHFTRGFYQESLGETDWAAFADVGAIKTLLIEDIAETPDERLAPLLARSLEESGRKLDTFHTWGDMHRLQLRHPLAMLPLIGGRWAFVDVPIGGSLDSLMKTAHGTTDERHRAGYGANARHVSDMGDPDSNWFVLLGGQDGWVNSANFLDQVPLWLEGRYIQMPLRPETVRERFRHVMELRP